MVRAADDVRTSSSQGRGEKTELWLKLAAGFLGVLTALFGFFSVLFAKKSDTANAKVDTSQAQIQALSSEIAQLKRQDAGKNAAGPAADPAEPTTDPTANGSEQGAGVKSREGDLTLTLGYCADLDSSAPNWSVSSDCGTYGAVNGDGDVRNLDVDSGLYGPNDADFAILPSGTQGSFAACSAATNYYSGISEEAIVPGLKLCARTTAGNFALLDVKKASHPDGGFASAAFHVTVWNGPEE